MISEKIGSLRYYYGDIKGKGKLPKVMEPVRQKLTQALRSL